MPGEQLLAGLRVAAQRQRRVLLGEAPQRACAIFSSSPFAFGVTAKLMTGSGKSIGGSSTVLVASSSTSPVCDVLQLRDGADVARAELVGRLVLLALERAAAGRSAPSRACARSTSVESAVSVPARTRKTLIRPANGSASVLKTNAAVPAPSTSIGAAFFAGDGHALDEQVEQRGRAEVLRRDAAGDREELAARDRVLERVRRPPRRRAPRPRGSAPSAPRRSRRRRRAASRGTPRPGRPARRGSRSARPPARPSGLVYAHMCSRSTMPVSSCSAPIGSCDGDAALGELRLQRLERAEEVGALAVEHVHEDDAREPELLGARPDPASSAPRRP